MQQTAVIIWRRCLLQLQKMRFPEICIQSEVWKIKKWIYVYEHNKLATSLQEVITLSQGWRGIFSGLLSKKLLKATLSLPSYWAFIHTSVVWLDLQYKEIYVLITHMIFYTVVGNKEGVECHSARILYKTYKHSYSNTVCASILN